MKDEETGLEIYGIPNAETRAAMKEAYEIARNRSVLLNREEELLARLEKDKITAFRVHLRGGLYHLYRTREEAVRNCNSEHEVVEVCVKAGCFCIVP
jgi:hypothetical protein